MLSLKNGLIALALAASAMPAFAQTAEDESAVRAVIANWYERVGKSPADAPWALMAPSSIDNGPGYSVPADLHSGSAAIRGPYLNHELAARAMRFSYDIDVLKVDARLAKAMVWERGYFYAWAAQKTYENAASAMFVLEKQANGEWKILAHDANSIGIPPNKITDPMPDLKDLYYQRCGPACDPVEDAKKAAQR
jgi:hypothetical protein